MSKKKSPRIRINVVDVEDIHNIRNPAYIVKEGGCVVSWNKEFERITNFTPSDIDNAECYQLFDGLQRQKGRYIQVCHKDCKFRTKGGARSSRVLREIWIKSKYVEHGSFSDVRRSMDIYIFPFISHQQKYALHILFDRGGVHDNKYFEEHMSIIRRHEEPSHA